MMAPKSAVFIKACSFDTASPPKSVKMGLQAFWRLPKLAMPCYLIVNAGAAGARPPRVVSVRGAG